MRRTQRREPVLRATRIAVASLERIPHRLQRVHVAPPPLTLILFPTVVRTLVVVGKTSDCIRARITSGPPVGHAEPRTALSEPRAPRSRGQVKQTGRLPASPR